MIPSNQLINKQVLVDYSTGNLYQMGNDNIIYPLHRKYTIHATISTNWFNTISYASSDSLLSQKIIIPDLREDDIIRLSLAAYPDKNNMSYKSICNAYTYITGIESYNGYAIVYASYNIDIGIPIILEVCHT